MNLFNNSKVLRNIFHFQHSPPCFNLFPKTIKSFTNIFNLYRGSSHDKTHAAGVSGSFLNQSTGPYKILQVDDQRKEIRAVKLGTDKLFTLSFKNLTYAPLSDCHINLNSKWDSLIRKLAAPEKIKVENIFQDFSKKYDCKSSPPPQRSSKRIRFKNVPNDD